MGRMLGKEAEEEKRMSRLRKAGTRTEMNEYRRGQGGEPQ